MWGLFPVTLECRVKRFSEDGIVGGIVNVSVDERILDGNGEIDPLKLNAISFDPANRAYLLLGKRVGTAFSDGRNIEDGRNQAYGRALFPVTAVSALLVQSIRKADRIGKHSIGLPCVSAGEKGFLHTGGEEEAGL